LARLLLQRPPRPKKEKTERKERTEVISVLLHEGPCAQQRYEDLLGCFPDP
jgi:hypothetical protein